MTQNVSHVTHNRYIRQCKGIDIDVYDVLNSFAVRNPAVQHAVKKLLCSGIRGHKDELTDLKEAGQAINRAIEIAEEGAF